MPAGAHESGATVNSLARMQELPFCISGELRERSRFLASRARPLASFGKCSHL